MSDLANPPDDDKGREDEVRGCIRSICANSDEAGLNKRETAADTVGST
jgi:hypothetical protein